MKLKFALMALAATALIGLSACGGDDDDETTGAGETTTEATTGAEETTTEAGGGGGGGGAIEVNADPGGSLAFEEASLEAPAGEVTIEFFNESSLPHDVRIEDSSGEDIGGTEEITGGETEATVDLEAGEYTFYCSVAGHREGGMEGPLTVE